jgi:hypothetical protein
MPQGPEQEMSRVWLPQMASFTTHEMASNLSQDDVVKYCQETGYVMEELTPSK